ncbi:zinc finger BED domain-containing RICESLEEPER 1-like [Olea europaea subsp. europaea]|uniref:Zinc finger BED domain-containing RICESLEEPER 1-like n=1 Tax=Olea europaea subsp. europaea TaxID=158383 RepID=A0A8S0S254_OLEEU|nr:zinc finger BED domain-containing RICESLEEPER 1-like [Olea europaea subsp. europaea]
MPLHNLQEALELEAKGQYLETDHCRIVISHLLKSGRKLRDICKLVDVAEVLFETRHASAGIYVHNLQELQASFIKEFINSDKLVRIISRRTLKKFEKYWKNMFLVLTVVIVLDPQYKTNYIEFSSLKYDTSSSVSEVIAISKSIHRPDDDYVTSKTREEYTTSDANSEFEEELPTSIIERRLYPNFGSNYLDEHNQFIQSNG